MDAAGNLYGTTSLGGVNSLGDVFPSSTDFGRRVEILDNLHLRPSHNRRGRARWDDGS